MTPVRSSTSVSAGNPRERLTTRAARGWTPVTITRSTPSGPSPADFKASATACSARGTYACSPKRSSHSREWSSPGLRQRSRNSSVATPRPSDSRSAGPSGANRKATAPSPPPLSSAPPGRPVRISERTTSVGTAADVAATSAPDPELTDPIMSKAEAPESRSRAAWMAVALVLSRYAGSDVANSTWPTSTPSGAAARHARAASTPIVVVSSSYEATARVPDPNVPRASPMRPRSSRQYGTYTP